MTESLDPTKPGYTESRKRKLAADMLYRVVEVTPDELRGMQLTPDESGKPDQARSPVHHHDHGDDHDHDFDGHHDHDHPDEVIEL